MYFGQPYHLPPPLYIIIILTWNIVLCLKKDMEYRLPQCDGQLLG